MGFLKINQHLNEMFVPWWPDMPVLMHTTTTTSFIDLTIVVLPNQAGIAPSTTGKYRGVTSDTA